MIMLDHQGYLADIDFEQYFELRSFEIERYKSSKLNSRRLIHRTKFEEKVEELIISTGLDSIIEKYCNNFITEERLEIIDK